MDKIFTNSLAPLTWRTYRAAQQDYERFCTSLNKPPVPASEDMLILYAAHLSLRLTHSSIRTYFSAIRSWHILQGVGDPLAGRLKLDLCLRGIKRMKTRPADHRLPITPFILSVIMGVLEQQPQDPDNIMFWAACCMGFFAFLRSGEFTVPSLASFDPAIHLSPTMLQRTVIQTHRWFLSDSRHQNVIN